MDHHEQHHQHHKKEREEELRHRKAHEHDHEQGKKVPYPIHPKWLLVLAFALILAAVLVWTFLIP
jgi:hypothetical protein